MAETKKRSSSTKSSSAKSGSSKSGSARTSGTRTGSSSRSKKKAAARRRRRRILFAVEALVILVLIGVLFFVSKLDRLQGNKTATVGASQQSAEELAEVEVEKNDNLSPTTMEKLEGYTTIAMFGVDTRTGILGKGSRSDTIILCCINNQTKDVKLCSVFRDTYLNLTNDSYNKCNAAYSFGGPDQAIRMLNMNLDLNISQYVAVDFTAIANAVDAIGGIEMEVTDAEWEHLNNYTVETSEVVGRTTTKLPGPGTYNLDGIQAVSYCRIRYTAGDDFKRAERQRTVVTKIIEKAKQADIATLNKIIDDVFPQVATNLKATDVSAMAADILSYNIVGSDGFPFDKTTGTFGRKGSCVVAADLTSNVQKLHAFLYPDESEYQVSDQVKAISARITQDTGVTGSGE